MPELRDVRKTCSLSGGCSPESRTLGCSILCRSLAVDEFDCIEVPTRKITRSFGQAPVALPGQFDNTKSTMASDRRRLEPAEGAAYLFHHQTPGWTTHRMQRLDPAMTRSSRPYVRPKRYDIRRLCANPALSRNLPSPGRADRTRPPQSSSK